MVGFPPKSSILIGFSIIFTIHFGVPLFLETPIYEQAVPNVTSESCPAGSDRNEFLVSFRLKFHLRIRDEIRPIHIYIRVISSIY